MGKYGFVAALTVCLVVGCDGGGTFGPGVVDGPDLRVTSIDIPALRQGNTSTVTVVVLSNGTDPVPAPFAVDLVVALDDRYSTYFCSPFEWRREVFEGDLAPCSELVLTADVSVSMLDPVGTPIYFLATADCAEEVLEGREDNNTMSATAEVAPPPRPDLQVASCIPQGSLRAGQDGTVLTTIVNSGERPAVAPFPVSLELYSDNDRISLFDSAEWTQLTDLAAGETASFPLAVSIPAGYTQPFLYFTATVDVPSAVVEDDETNNEREGSIVVLPPPKADLTVSIDFPTTGIPNDTLAYSMTVRNMGQLGSPATSVRYTFYLVVSGTEYEGNTFTEGFGALAPGTSETADLIIGTSGVGWGDVVRIRAWVDPNDTIDESNENNNTDEADCSF